MLSRPGEATGVSWNFQAAKAWAAPDWHRKLFGTPHAFAAPLFCLNHDALDWPRKHGTPLCTPRPREFPKHLALPAHLFRRFLERLVAFAQSTLAALRR